MGLKLVGEADCCGQLSLPGDLAATASREGCLNGVSPLGLTCPGSVLGIQCQSLLGGRSNCHTTPLGLEGEGVLGPKVAAGSATLGWLMGSCWDSSKSGVFGFQSGKMLGNHSRCPVNWIRPRGITFIPSAWPFRRRKLASYGPL